MSTNPQNGTPKDAEEVSKYVSSQKRVGLALIGFTILAVAAAFVPFGSLKSHTLAVGVIVLINAFLVAGISMHLKTEKKTITQFLIFTIIFGGALFALTALAYFDSTGYHH
jgi:hypothetical protein